MHLTLLQKRWKWVELYHCLTLIRRTKAIDEIVTLDPLASVVAYLQDTEILNLTFRDHINGNLSL